MLKELRNYILRIIRFWSLSFSIRAYLSLYVLPIIKLVFRYSVFDVFSACS